MAGSARNIRAGKAFVEINGDDSKLQKALQRASARMRAFGAGVSRIGAGLLAAGAAIAAPFALATGVFARFGDMLDKASQRTGLTVEALSELGFAAERSGAALEDVEKSVRRLQVSVRNGTIGLQTIVRAFDELGLSADDLASLSPEDQFLAIAEGLSRISDPGRRAALAVELLGKSGAKLLPLLALGAGGIEALRLEARALGLTIDTETAISAAKFTDALGDLRSQVRAVAVAVGAALAPALIATIRVLNPIVAQIIMFAKANAVLITAVSAAAGGLVGLGIGMVILGGSITLAGFALAGLSTLVGLLLSPIALVVAAVAGLAGAIFTFSSTAKLALSAVRLNFGTLADGVSDAMAAVRDAITAGNLELALGVVTAGLEVVWLEGLSVLEGAWNAMFDRLIDRGIGFFDFFKVFGDEAAGLRSLLGVARGVRDEAATSRVDAAKRELEQAIEEARQISGQGGDRPPRFQDLFDIDAVADRIKALGSFGSENIGRQFGGALSTERSQLDETKKITKNTKATADGISRLDARLSFV